MIIPRMGTCPVCERKYTLLADGRVNRHGSGRRKVWPPEICDGWGELASEVMDRKEAEEAANEKAN